MKLAIMTNFHDFNGGYSLTGIVLDQVEMLERHGHEVHLYMSESHVDTHDYLLPKGENIHVHTTVPHEHLTDSQNSKRPTKEQVKHRERLGSFFVEEFADKDVVFTHDAVFTGWNWPFAKALQDTRDETRGTGFLHWIHSIPCGFRDWWDLGAYGNPDGKNVPDRLPDNHRLVFPTAVKQQHVAEQFRCTADKVAIIPHIKDPRTWFDFCDDTRAFIDAYPGLLQGDVVCVYPASSDRLTPKQLHIWVMLQAAMKRRCLTTCFLCANQWASRQRASEDLAPIYELAEESGLITHRNRPTPEFAEEFIFSSEFDGNRFQSGLPKRVLRELMLLSNVFIFPSIEESFGLVMPEAALSGAFMVLNKDLDAAAEVMAHQGAYFGFGSRDRQLHVDNWEEYLNNVAGAILARMRRNEVVQTKTWTRQRLNMDRLYFEVYAPLMEEFKCV